jgi:hypothetical protein
MGCIPFHRRGENTILSSSNGGGMNLRDSINRSYYKRFTITTRKSRRQDAALLRHWKNRQDHY